MNSGIYQIRCLVNDHIYVGSAKNLNERKRLHFLSLVRNKHHNHYLQKSFNLHGESNFIFEVLCEIENIEKLIDWEQYFIDILNPEYNECKIAGSQLGMKRTKESKDKMKRNHANFSGNKNPMYGKFHSIEAKNKISKNNSYKLFGENNPKAKFTEKDVLEMRRLHEECGFGSTKIAKIYNTNRSTIDNIIYYIHWKHLSKTEN